MPGIHVDKEDSRQIVLAFFWIIQGHRTISRRDEIWDLYVVIVFHLRAANGSKKKMAL